MSKMYVVLCREIDEDDGVESVSIATYTTFETLRSNSSMYDKDTEVLVFIANDQIFVKLDGVDNVEYDTAVIMLTALFDDSVTFDSILNDEYNQLENRILTLEAENTLLKEQLAECQKSDNGKY